jgi:hypothetical protein
MKICESHVNATEGYRFSEDIVVDLEDTIFDPDDENLPGEIFRYSQKEFGRCVSKVYVTRNDGEALHIGWVFEKKEHYEDTGDPFLHETWVTLLDEDRTEHIRTYHVIEGSR